MPYAHSVLIWISQLPQAYWTLTWVSSVGGECLNGIHTVDYDLLVAPTESA